MTQLHFKYGQCENCGESIEKSGTLAPIHFWLKKDSRRIPYYLYICSDCFDSREDWCESIFPDHCESCNKEIENGDHFLEKTTNRDGKSIETYGLADDENCKIICHDCSISNSLQTRNA